MTRDVLYYELRPNGLPLIRAALNNAPDKNLTGGWARLALPINVGCRCCLSHILQNILQKFCSGILRPHTSFTNSLAAWSQEVFGCHGHSTLCISNDVIHIDYTPCTGNITRLLPHCHSCLRHSWQYGNRLVIFASTWCVICLSHSYHSNIP